MEDFEVTISLTEATVEQLAKSGYQLYGFLASQVGDDQALPLLWNNWPCAENIAVKWTAQYDVYTSFSSLVSGEAVSVGMSQSMSIGQLLTVDGTGTGSLSENGIPGFFSVLNSSTKPQLCGLTNSNNPFCALPLHGLSGQVFGPLAKVLLLFAPIQVSCSLGDALNQWPGSSTEGVLIDVSTIGSCSISFDINNGWNWDNQIWGKIVPFEQNLTSELIYASTALTNSSHLLSNLLA